MLDQIDIAAIQAQITQKIHELGDEIRGLLQTITTPLSDAVQKAVSTMEQTLNGFDPDLFLIRGVFFYYRWNSFRDSICCL